MSPDSLQVTLTTDKPAYRAGESVTVALKLTNGSRRETLLEFPNSQRYDFAIDDSAGVTVWRWSADRMFAQMIGTERLAPGDSREYHEQFAARLPAGNYRATGVVTATGTALRALTTFTVQ